MKGQLSEHPLAELIREITSGGLSGALRLARGRVQAVAYALGGEVVRARSNLRVHHLMECARRAGLDAEGRLSAVVTGMMGEAEAAAALAAADRDWLDSIITRRVGIEDAASALERELDDIKVVVELGAT